MLPFPRIVPAMPDATVEKRRRGFWMRMAREHAQLSQASAAELLGLKSKSKSTLSKLENGGQEPKASLIARMAALYGVPVELLIHPPMAADEVIERRLTEAVRDAEALEREDWERGAGPAPRDGDGPAAGPRRRSA